MIAIICLLCLFGTIYYVWYRLFSYQGLPRNFPFATSDGTFLSRGRASLKSVWSNDCLVLAGYREHSKEGRPYILPDIFAGHQVMLPKEQMSWLTSQPTSVLSQREGSNEFLAAGHNFFKFISTNDSEWTFVANMTKDMTRELNNKTSAILNEIQYALESVWGSDHQSWKEVDLLDTILEVMARVVSRVFVGLPLCRDPAYIASTTCFGSMVLVEALLIQLTPKLLRPLSGYLVSRYDWYHFKRMAGRVHPLIKERARKFSATQEDFGKHRKTPEEPNDLLSRLMQEAYRRNEDPCRPESHTVKLLAIVNWAAIHVQAITLGNALIDIAHSPDSLEILHELREEAATAEKVEPASARWSRAEVTKLPKTDSVMTESLRLWGFAHGVIKLVVAKDGVTLPSGEHLPCGAKVGIGGYAVHHDSDVYAGNPFEFDAMRFVKGQNSEESSGLNLPMTSENYLPFSHGKYSCAGRFLANHLLKLTLAQIVLRYDIKPNTAPRPPNPWLSYVSPPPLGYKLKIRRRKT